MSRHINNPVVLDAKSALNEVGYLPVLGRFSQVTFYIEGSAGVASGAVSIEGAFNKDYAGTWHAYDTVAVVASTVRVVTVSGGFGAIRARISTVMGGGTVTVRAIAVE